jgi:hypothetical protein
VAAGAPRGTPIEPVTGVRHVVPGPYRPAMNAAGQPHHSRSRMHEYNRAVRTLFPSLLHCIAYSYAPSAGGADGLLARALRSVSVFRPVSTPAGRSALARDGRAPVRLGLGSAPPVSSPREDRCKCCVAPLWAAKAMRRRLGKGHRVE